MRRWTLRNTVFLLLLGAIVNVGVAWMCVAFAPQTVTMSGQDATLDDRAWLESACWVPPASHASDGIFRLQQRDTAGAQIAELSYFYRVENGAYFAWGGDVFALTTRAGWPQKALVGGTLRSPVGSESLVHAFRLPQWNSPTVPRDAPMRPIWPGFAINTVFYAFILWGLFAAPFALRRRRRIKRGLCPKCAYPVGTNEVCTECGAAVKK